jgi:nitrate reductase NapAB chaperone NapD
MEQCECKECVYSRKVLSVIEGRDVDKLIETINELMDLNVNIGFDLDYHKCVMNGSWPSSVEQLSTALVKSIFHPNRTLETVTG